MAHSTQQYGGWSGPVNQAWYAGSNGCGNYTGTVNNNNYYMVDNSHHTNVNQRYDPRVHNNYNYSSTRQTPIQVNQRYDPRHQNVQYSNRPRQTIEQDRQQPPNPPPSPPPPPHAPPSYHTCTSHAAQPPPYSGSNETSTAPSQITAPRPSSGSRASIALPPPPANPPTVPSEVALKVRPEPSIHKAIMENFLYVPQAKSQVEHKRKICRVDGCREIHVHRMLHCEEQEVRSGWRGERLKTVWVEKKIKSLFCQQHTCQSGGAGTLGRFCPCPRYPWEKLCSCCAAKEGGSG